MLNTADGIDTVDPAGRPAEKPPSFIGLGGASALIAIVILVISSPAARFRLGALVPALAILIAVHLIPFYVLGRCAAVTVEAFELFFGGALVRWRHDGTWFSVNWFPLGGFVKFKGIDVATGGNTEGTWHRLPRIARAAICLSGPTALLLLALIALGPASFREDVRETSTQVAELAVHPAAVIKRFLAFVDSSPFRIILGAIGVKLAFVNLLPLPLVNGGQAIVELANLHRHRRLMTYFELASLALILAGFIIIVYNALAVAVRG